MSQEIANKIKLYKVIAYIPLVQFVLLFTDIEKKYKKEYEKELRQGIGLLVAYIFLSILFSILGIQGLSLVYFCLTVFLIYSTYNGKYIEIPIIKELLEQFEESQKKSNKSQKNESLSQPSPTGEGEAVKEEKKNNVDEEFEETEKDIKEEKNEPKVTEEVKNVKEDINERETEKIKEIKKENPIQTKSDILNEKSKILDKKEDKDFI